MVCPRSASGFLLTTKQRAKSVMITLALEFSSERRSVALVREQQILAESARIGGRSTRPFVLIKEAIDSAGGPLKGIECVAVGLGPGSYAGIRQAIAVAQGWCMATSVRVSAVNSFAAIARGLAGDGLTQPSW